MTADGGFTVTVVSSCHFNVLCLERIILDPTYQVPCPLNQQINFCVFVLNKKYMSSQSKVNDMEKLNTEGKCKR